MYPLTFFLKYYLCKRINCVIILLGLFSHFNVWSQARYSIQDVSGRQRLDTYVGAYIDSTGVKTFDEIKASDFQRHFRFLDQRALKFGYLRPTLWLKVVVKNESMASDWYLELPAPFLEYVDFYIENDDKWNHIETGYFRPFNQRGIPHTSFVVPLHFSIDSISTVYIKIGGTSPKTFPLFVVEKEEFNDKTRYADVGYGIFFGILLVMIFYNVVIFLTLRQGNYLLYVCTIICTLLIFAASTGYGGKFLWPESPMMNYYAGRLTLPVLTLFLAVFAIRFLEAKKYSRIIYYSLATLVPVSVIALVLVVTGILPSAGNNLISVTTVLLITSGIVCRIKGNKIANFFIAAWTVYLFGGLMLTLRNSGFFEFNFWTTHLVEFGAGLETTIIALALGDRYRRYKEEKEEAQRLALKLQQEITGKLEIMVRQRTDELSKANEELSATLETNQLQTEIIKNKNEELDAFFYRISHDLKGPVSSMLGLSVIAQQEVKDPLALDYLEKQNRQVERLNHIITGLINLTQLNNANLKRELVDFNKLIDGCIQSFSGARNFSSITFKKDIRLAVPFYCEWVLVNAIFQNLIENAIKYSIDALPCVGISVREESDWVCIEVSDNGLGISTEHQVKIFDLFYRASGNIKGSGLGLYILKRSVEMLKGTIELKSEIDKGSTFTVRLPLITQPDAVTPE